MGGARIFVLHKKDLIRFGVIALVAIVFIVTALVLLIPGRREMPQAGGATRFVPGTYSSTILLYNEPVHVRVTVSENEILSIYMTDMAEVQRTFYPLFEPRLEDLAQEILRYQSAHIRPQTDYPVTTSILQTAVKTALEMAYAD